jgi:putative addiction module killer protein
MFKGNAIVIYANKKGREPFFEWFSSLKDRTTRARIRNRIARLELGHLGDCEAVGDGIFELRLFFGSGYRIYFAEYESATVLLCGGDKKTQSKDISKAKSYWKEFKEVKYEKVENI